MHILPGQSAPVNWADILTPQHDHREQLVNAGDTGPLTTVSIAVNSITSLRGILLDIDPGIFEPVWTGGDQQFSPSSFFERVIAPMMTRNSVLDKAEVRLSGSGLHVLLKFDRPVIFETDAERAEWAAIVKIVQRLLPTDLDCPGINAMTRPVGSINSKNGARVELLRRGSQVTMDEISELATSICKTPFRNIARIFLGSERIAPCPICGKAGSRLDALDHIGKCYAGCGTVKLEHLYDIFLSPRNQKGDSQ